MNPVWEAQALSYLKLTGECFGGLIDFDVSLVKNSIKKIIL
jgi:hypothetical protein